MKTPQYDDVLYSSESVEWLTPPEIVAAVIEVLGKIDLDPCSEWAGANILAGNHYTKVQDGLSLPWTNIYDAPARLFANPPYGHGEHGIEPWVDKLLAEVALGHVSEAIVLAPARTDTKWLHKLRDWPFCLVLGRLAFTRPGETVTTSAPFPSALFYYGPNEQRFVAVMESRGIGFVAKRVRT